MNLNQVTIPVASIDRSIKFYSAFGLNLIVKSQAYARFECPEGHTTFSIHQTNEISNADGVWIYFEITNLDQYVESLLQKGFIFEELPVDKPWLWRESRLKDPDGNQLILYFAGTNRTNPPWRIV